MNRPKTSNSAPRTGSAHLALLFLCAASFAHAADRPNGRIAFDTFEEIGGDREIYSIEADGSGLRQLTHNNVDDRLPVWSPDGTEIAFVSQRPDASDAIFVMSAAGTGRHEIVGASPSAMSWSPDGRHIAFDDRDPEDAANWSIRIVNVDSGHERELTLGWNPAWSPSGDRILFAKWGAENPSQLGNPRLHTIRPDGADEQPLPSGDHDGFGDVQPAWSRAGDRIAFVVNVWDFSDQVFVADGDGTNRVFFHGCPANNINCGSHAQGPQFSPDGREMVFSMYGSYPDLGGIYVKNLDGTGLRLLARNAGLPSWQAVTDAVDNGLPEPSGHPHAGGLNVLTGALAPLPPGCMAVDLPATPTPGDATVVTRVIDIPGIQSQTTDVRAEITLWRVACADEGYSVVLMRVQGRPFNDGYFALPSITAGIDDVTGGSLAYQARLSPSSEGILLAASDAAEVPSDDDGMTFVLSVDPVPMDASDAKVFGPEEYNQSFTVELGWDLFASTSRRRERFTIPAFDPAQSPQQFWQPVFNGRHTGSYVVEGIPRTGLVLQIAEAKPFGGLADRNYAFVTLFTYTDDGQQLWLTGNTEPGAPGMPEIVIELYRPEGGSFLTVPPGSFSSDDVDMKPQGSLSLRVVDCNTLEGDYDFREGALAGVGTLTFKRLIRVAGYDCNPWED